LQRYQLAPSLLELCTILIIFQSDDDLSLSHLVALVDADPGYAADNL
jgi:hypothetical protein